MSEGAISRIAFRKPEGGLVRILPDVNVVKIARRA